MISLFPIPEVIIKKVFAICSAYVDTAYKQQTGEVLAAGDIDARQNLDHTSVRLKGCCDRLDLWFSTPTLKNDAVYWLLDASSHLYIWVCPLVCRSVRLSVGWSVGDAFVQNKGNQ